ncbi:hypothetical protein AtDm6_2173 [Acetobacter tropicalis]|uniref:Uncharacterized protein n=1 Tax=Acetobacter tropicalis TaxID=104102 RepID=A0A094YMJ2_9PROT|nr:hypothetical protein AtDm6_2173 [Acetobacter tropicalis]
MTLEFHIFEKNFCPISPTGETQENCSILMPLLRGLKWQFL